MDWGTFSLPTGSFLLKNDCITFGKNKGEEILTPGSEQIHCSITKQESTQNRPFSVFFKNCSKSVFV
jgi:hypothetical protein